MEIGGEGDRAVSFDDFGEGAVGGNFGGAVAEEFGDDEGGGGFLGIFFGGGLGKDGEVVADVEFAAVEDGVEVGVVFFEDNEFAVAAVGEGGVEAGGHDASVI